MGCVSPPLPVISPLVRKERTGRGREERMGEGRMDRREGGRKKPSRRILKPG